MSDIDIQATSERTFGGARRTWMVALGLIGVLANADYARRGAGFVLDDWFALRNAHFGGPLAAAGHDQWLARPGAGVVYALTFGLIGRHPQLFLYLQMAVEILTAVLLFRLLDHFVARPVAMLVAATWLLLPDHGSLTMWPSADNIGIALCLLVAGCVVLMRPAPSPSRAQTLGVAALFTCSVLCYEATAPTALAALFLLPRLSGRRLNWKLALPSAIGLSAAGLWMVIFWNPAKNGIHQTADLSLIWPAHFGWGILPNGVLARASVALCLVGISIALVRLLPRYRPADASPEWLMAAGLIVIVLGVIPFVRYFYAPLGPGDRVCVISAVGGAMVLAGLAARVWAWRPPVAVLGGMALVVGSTVATFQAAQAWHDGGRDARLVLAAIPPAAARQFVVVGPQPHFERNVSAFLDRSNIASAVQLQTNVVTARARLSVDQADFDAVPPSLRVDLRNLPRR